jgi:hypothetical protein
VGIETTELAILSLVRHWGLLLFLVGALLVYSAYTPAIRVPIPIVAITEKIAIVTQLLRLTFKPRLATSTALFDAGCTILYLLYPIKLYN